MSRKKYDWRDPLIEDGCAWDDFLVVPQYSDVITRADRDGGPTTKTFLTPNISLNIPIMSAAMDTVTGSRLAIAIASLGGIGILDRHCSINDEVEKVKRVKSAQEILIRKPYVLHPNSSIGKAKRLVIEKNIDSVPIVNSHGILVGLLTKHELNGVDNFALVEKYMKPLKELVCAKVSKPLSTDVAIKLAGDIFRNQHFGKLPFIDNKTGELLGLVTEKDLSKFSNTFPDATIDESGRLRVGAAIGVGEDTLERTAELIKAGVDVLVLDIAHAHSIMATEMIERIKADFPKFELIVGNVATAKAVRHFIDLGVSAIKVGIGPGAVCTTRIVSGCGVPQAAAVLQCAREAEGSGIPIIADGDIRHSGDIAKAIACGAWSVMVGTCFVGVRESPGKIKLNKKGQLVKIVRGMSSRSVNEEIRGSEYYKKTSLKDMVQPEGVKGRVLYRGTLRKVLLGMVGGLRSCMSYVGVKTIEDLQRPFDGKLTRVTSAALRESFPHDIEII